MKQSAITDETPIAMLTVGQLKKVLEIDKILGFKSLVCEPAIDNVLTVSDVARLTGYSIATIYKFTSERKIPFYKPEHGGRKLYFNRKEIMEWMQRHSTNTIQQDSERMYNQFFNNNYEKEERQSNGQKD